jgi:gamma-glutamyl-gamma-aminobutyrate hydrolase PuuD
VKKIGLTSRVVAAGDYVEPRDALSHDWIEWTQAQCWTPIALFNSVEDPAAYLRATGVDALILTGGNDAVSNGPDSSYCDLRNKTEFAFLDVAIEERIPVLAVCRGMHILNLYFGGSIEPDIGAAKSDHIATMHSIEISNSVGGIFNGARICTNSYHGQGFCDDRLASDLVAFAHSSEGFVEGLFHLELPIAGIQWHPERNHPSARLDAELANRLFREGGFWHETI